MAVETRTRTTDKTVVGNTPPHPADEMSPIVYLGMGIACIEMGRVFLEHGLKQVNGWSGLRSLLKRADRTIEALEQQQQLGPHDSGG